MNTFWTMICSNAIVATILAIGATLLGRIWKNPAAMHVLWLVVLLKLFAPPLLTADLPFAGNWLRPVPGPGSSERLFSATTAHDADYTTAVGGAVSDALDSSSNRQSSGTTSSGVSDLRVGSLSALLAAIWICGSAAMALRYAVLIHDFSSLVRGFEPPPHVVRLMVQRIAKRLGLKRVPEVLMTSRSLPPLVWSVGVAPCVILPSRLFARLDTIAQSTVVAHELVHVNRRDDLVRLLELAAITVFWWHPVVWWAGRKLRDLEEQCCDSRVLELSPQHSRNYATALVETLEFLSEQPRLYIPLPTAVCSVGSLSRRIRMLTRRQTNRLNARTALLVAALVALPLVFTVAVAQEAKPAAAAAVLRGRVETKPGGPLAGVRVRVAIPSTEMRFVNPGSGPIQFETISGDNGEYRLEIPGITKPARVSIDAMKPGYRRLSGTLMQGGDAPRPEVAPGVVIDTDLNLQPALYFRGVVVDEDGKPIPSVEIFANASGGGASGGVERTVSSQDGQFELFNYPPQPFTLNNATTKGRVDFFHPEYVSRRIADVYSLAENERSDLRIVLPTGYKVSGTVRDAMGNKVPQVMVKAVNAMASDRKAIMTDANGSFALRGLPAGQTVLSVRALDLKQKIQLPIALNRDANDLDVRLQEMSLPPNLKSVAVLGMKLTDLTPELKAAYDLWDSGGALILDPGSNSQRLRIGTLAHGYNFWMVGNKRITNVREFVEQILSEADAQVLDQYSIRVVYSFSTLEFDGTNTQYLKLTKDDIAQLKTVLDQLTAAPN